MNAKAYALSVSFAATVGLLLSVVPLVRSVLEYRSPELVEPRPELASLETFVLSKSKLGVTEDLANAPIYARRGIYMLKFWEREEWQAMYEATKSQHVESVKHGALRGAIAYGSLAVLSIVLLVTHLLWARRAKESLRAS